MADAWIGGALVTLFPRKVGLREHAAIPADVCDGCGRALSLGDPVISGIHSCCGDRPQCLRVLCYACVAVAARLAGLLEPKTEGAPSA